jgi:hypothetical protein
MISCDFDTNLMELNPEQVTSIDTLPTEVLLKVFALPIIADRYEL